MIGNAELCPNYFSTNVSRVAVVFCQQIKKKKTILRGIVGFLKIVSEIQRLVRKSSQKIN